MKSILPTRYGGLTRCPYLTLFLFASALLFSACNHYSEQQSLFLKKEQNYYTAEAVEYELALHDKRTETLAENRDIIGSPIISNLLNRLPYVYNESRKR